MSWRRCQEGVGASDAWGCELVRWDELTCDWQWRWASLTHTCLRSLLIRNTRHVPKMLKEILILPAVELMPWKWRSHPWMKPNEDDPEQVDARWATWCLTMTLVPNDEGDPPTWYLRWSCRWWWGSLMLGHDECCEPLSNRSDSREQKVCESQLD